MPEIEEYYIKYCPQCGEDLGSLNIDHYCYNCGWGLEKKYKDLEDALAQKDYVRAQFLVENYRHFIGESPSAKDKRLEEEQKNKSLKFRTIQISAFIMAAIYLIFNSEGIVGYFTDKPIAYNIVNYIVSLVILWAVFMIPIAIGSYVSEELLCTNNQKKNKKNTIIFLAVIVAISFFIWWSKVN